MLAAVSPQCFQGILPRVSEVSNAGSRKYSGIPVGWNVSVDEQYH